MYDHRIKLAAKLFLTALALLGTSTLPLRESPTHSFLVEVDNEIKALDITNACAGLTEQDSYVKISINLTADSFSNWQNVFQTSSLNNGIRLEIDANGNVGLIVSKIEPDQFLVVSGSKRLTLRDTHTIQLRIRPDTDISMSIDGEPTVRSTGKTRPLCNDPRFGIGFDESRRFSGRASIAIESGKLKSVLPVIPYSKIIGQLLLAAAAVLHTIQVTRTYQDEDESL